MLDDNVISLALSCACLKTESGPSLNCPSRNPSDALESATYSSSSKMEGYIGKKWQFEKAAGSTECSADEPNGFHLWCFSSSRESVKCFYILVCTLNASVIYERACHCLNMPFTEWVLQERTDFLSGMDMLTFQIASLNFEGIYLNIAHQYKYTS